MLGFNARLLRLECSCCPPPNSRTSNKQGLAQQKPQVVPTIETAPATKAAEDQQKQDAETQRNLVKYTKWLVIVGSIQFAALILQAIVFVLTLRVTQVNGEKQLRAYICVSKGLLKLDRPESPEAQVYFKNGGLTPAYAACANGYGVLDRRMAA